ncbi:MAG: acetyl-CoA C-acyltransferase, partial [Acidimicrobiia bacterium]|nr:acetyl-CoA C-acyltransferase [Acidimicrobiia bacterium]
MNPVICAIARTPVGKFNGAFTPLKATDLATVAMRGAIDRAGIPTDEIGEVIFGHVIQAGQGQATARFAAFNAGVPMSVPATVINKVCLSSMTAIQDAARRIRLGEAKFILAGGMESMTNAPHIVVGARQGFRYGDGVLADALNQDGLLCAFDRCFMGETTDSKNKLLGIGRTEQDEWAAASHERAVAATKAGAFDNEIVPVDVPQRRGEPLIVESDEGLRPGTTVESLSKLRPAFTSDGTVTAGNASQISDGAAALIVADRAAAEAAGLPVVAEILAYGQTAGPDPTLHERPTEAIDKALATTDLDRSDLDLVEINEAFAAVALWSAKMLDIEHDKVNVHGGAVAIGHPLGASGARITIALINALRLRGGGIGAAALCGGG